MSDLISREEAIAKIEKAMCEDGFRSGTGLVHKTTVYEILRSLPDAQECRWSGLWSEPKDDNSIYGEKLMEGDTIYLLGIEGAVRQECGAWGWGSAEYVPWEQLQAKAPHNNNPVFCYCDNFISFWELKWNFDDGYDWDGVPYIKHEPGKESGG